MERAGATAAEVAKVGDPTLRTLERSEVAALRVTMRNLGLVVAETDLDLRYVWVDNPHPDFDEDAVVGKRDDELIPEAEAAAIMSLKREAIHRYGPVKRLLEFERSDGRRCYSMFAYPVCDSRGEIEGIFTIGFDVSRTSHNTVG